jgi:hypothetical protein
MSQPQNAQSSSKEGRIALAINAYKSGYFSSLRSAATTYDVPESTLRTRLKGRRARQETRSTNHKLSNTEELALVQWILSWSDRGLPLKISHIRQMANLLLQKRNTDQGQTCKVGIKWPYNFVQRHPEV